MYIYKYIPHSSTFVLSFPFFPSLIDLSRILPSKKSNAQKTKRKEERKKRIPKHKPLIKMPPPLWISPPLLNRLFNLSLRSDDNDRDLFCIYAYKHEEMEETGSRWSGKRTKRNEKIMGCADAVKDVCGLYHFVMSVSELMSVASVSYQR
jgi:hypothetical protein